MATPGFLSEETKKKLAEGTGTGTAGRKKRLLLYPWYFLPEHRVREDDVNPPRAPGP